MRTPFLVLIIVYSIAILGMVLIPGIDDKGQLWHMSFFHAFYFVSYTATTIGFGEIPYPLTDMQRLWALITIYTTVIAWFYALGKIITLFQDKTFQQVVSESRFRREVNNIYQPFYLVCGLGETGKAVVCALTEEHYRAVVVDQNADNINELSIMEMKEYVPALTGNASLPRVLEYAGIKHKNCQAVIAVTISDETNLQIAITSKLLHPGVPVICRSEIKAFENNMLSFNTDYIVNPFEVFANVFAMALHSPALYMIYDWLTGATHTTLNSPVQFEKKTWILLGYGRLGKALHQQLKNAAITTVVIDPSVKAQEVFYASNHHHQDDQFILATGTDAASLKQAGIETASGLIVGSDNDANNLSAIMTARQLNPQIFFVARQNSLNSTELYTAIHQNNIEPGDRPDSGHDDNLPDTLNHLIMRPREIIGRKIRALLISPLLLDFLNLAKKESAEWANISISRLTAVVGKSTPHNWTIILNRDNAPALARALSLGRHITLGQIIQDPKNRRQKIGCIPLLLQRDKKNILLPDENFVLKPDDQLLFCGSRKVKITLTATVAIRTNLDYVMTFKNDPESFIGRKLSNLFNKQDRRKQKRLPDRINR